MKRKPSQIAIEISGKNHNIEKYGMFMINGPLLNGPGKARL